MLICGVSFAQVQTTSNVVGTTVNPAPAGVQQSWSGFTNTTSTGGGLSGGNVPGYNPSTGQFMFGYAQGTFAYTMAINSALSGTGIQVGGIEYGLTYYNEQFSRGTLSVTAAVTNSNNATLHSYTHNLPQTTSGWTQWGQTQTFINPYLISTLGNATLHFTGKDDRFWAGYYGPQFKDPYLRFNYTVDPCVTNPAYSPSCPGYNSVVISGNLLPGTIGIQSYAIATALSAAGAGATIHGFDYGYSYSVAGRTCSFIDLFGICITGWNYSSAGVATVVTNSNNQELHSNTTTHDGNNDGISGNYSTGFRLSSSLPISSLGAFAMAPWTSGTATINNMWSNALYSPDPCIANPLSSQSCAGYAAAYLNQQCTLNALYDPSCPGYQTAQCNISPLYSQVCPGYQAAYFTQQCNLNGLYSTTCPNYAQAYAKNNLLDSTTTTQTKVTAGEPSLSISSTGKVETTVSKTGDSNVDSVIEQKATSASPSDATAAVQLTPPTGGQNAVAQTPAQSQQKTETKTASPSNERQQTAKSDTRKENAQQRAKEEMKKAETASSFEGQIAVQASVIGAMSFVPGFDAYQTARIIDINALQLQRQYGKDVVDNKRLGWGLFGPSDRRHQEMVDGQYR